MEMHFAGKYGHGQITDPKTWKANFRCALNSLPDIEEVKDKSINKGHQAKRVFRMLPVTPKSRGETSDGAFPVTQEASSEHVLLIKTSFCALLRKAQQGQGAQGTEKGK